MVTYGVKLQRSDDLRLSAHPEGVSLDVLTAWCAERRAAGQRLAVDLFSGAGGLSLGLEQAGWTVAASVDHDPKALKTHEHNFAGVALSTDMSDSQAVGQLIDLIQPLEIDLIGGGPPCQPFSRAGRSKIRSLVADGRRDAHDQRRELWRSFVQIALAVRPRAILMENVPDMALSDDFRVVRRIVEDFETAGYSTQIRLVDAWLYGVPQHRKRLIVLARRDTGQFTWPSPVPLTTLAQAIRDLPPLLDSTGGRRLSYEPKEQSPFAVTMREGSEPGVVHDHMTRPVRADDRDVFAMMNSTTLYSSIPAQMRRYKADTFDDKYKRLGWDTLSRSITAHIAKDGYWYIHPEEQRTLTVREAARVQTFPDRFRFAGTRSDAFRQIGNAVPPMLGQAAATALAPLSSDDEKGGLGTNWREARRQLTRWARRLRRKDDSWHLLPGPDVTHPVAAVSALLSGTHTSGSDLGLSLEGIRRTSRLGDRSIRQLRADVTTPTAREAVERLASLVDKRAIWRNVGLVSQVLGMRPAEDKTFRLLCGQDVLLTSQSAIRVASRVTASQSSSKNRLSDGRVDLARLVGSGNEAPLRMAALHILGTRVCRSTEPRCGDCPIAPWCATAAATEITVSST